MLPTTPMGSRRIMLVCPSIYSPPAACRQRAAPAKKRKQSTTAGSSSFEHRQIGLAAVEGFEGRKFLGVALDGIGQAQQQVLRWAGVVRLPLGKRRAGRRSPPGSPARTTLLAPGEAPRWPG